MTEKNVNFDQRHSVPPGRFAAALIAAPLLVTALTFWLFIPIYALILGGPAFVVLGGPVFWLFLRRNAPDYLPLVMRAVLLQPILFAALALCAMASGDTGLLGAIPMFFAFGCLFAALWAAAFTALYRPLVRTI